jgi:hypothetical protein
LVLANAAHSAHPLRTAAGVRIGILANLLSRVASSFVGIAGAVDQTHMSDIVARLLPSPGDASGGWQPTERLRRLRAEAAQQFRHNQTRDSLLRLLYCCMYVYYGHPNLRLTLDGSRPAARSSDAD